MFSLSVPADTEKHPFSECSRDCGRLYAVGTVAVLSSIKGSGKIDFHWKMKPHNMMFLPQKPYFPSGDITLRQQILYPYKAMPIEKDVDIFFDILKELKLDHLFHRCHGFDTPVEWDW